MGNKLELVEQKEKEFGHVTVHISGKAMNAFEGYELKYLVSYLNTFERLSEKTYLYLVNRDRFRKQDSTDFGVYIQNIRHGSFKADLWIKLTTCVLPLMPVVGEHGDIIWEGILKAFEYFKTILEARQEGNTIRIENIGDETQVIIGNNNTINVYPSYTPELAVKLAPEFIDMANNTDDHVESVSFANKSTKSLVIDKTNQDLFKKREFLLPDEKIIVGEITVLNKHNNSGKLYVSNGDIEEGEYRFEVQKNIRYPEYLASSVKKKAKYRCHVKVKYTPSTMEERISGIKLIEKI